MHACAPVRAGLCILPVPTNSLSPYPQKSSYFKVPPSAKASPRDIANIGGKLPAYQYNQHQQHCFARRNTLPELEVYTDKIWTATAMSSRL